LQPRRFFTENLKSILYLTDNSLDEKLAEFCKLKLIDNCDSDISIDKVIPIISVSQKPIRFGKNICVGEIGRSWLSLYKQMMAGLEACETKYVGIAEHDVIYGPEHLQWIPPTDDTFYYNHNCWLVQWGGNHPELNGMYSYWPKRFALSQLVCNKELLKESIKERLSLLENGYHMVKGLKGAGEPGVADKIAIGQLEAGSGRPTQLQRYLKGFLKEYKSESFKTEQPNLDIRHSSNFTGPKRGKMRRYDLPYWGDFRKLMEFV
jgi:hypothetical protein